MLCIRFSLISVRSAENNYNALGTWDRIFFLCRTITEREGEKERVPVSYEAVPPRWGSAFSLFTAKRDNSVHDGTPVPKRDIECNHGNRAVAILVHSQLSIIGKIRGSRPGIRDILLPVKWRLRVSVYANYPTVQGCTLFLRHVVFAVVGSRDDVLTRRKEVKRITVWITN